MKSICTKDYVDYLNRKACSILPQSPGFIHSRFYIAMASYIHCKNLYYMARETKQNLLMQTCLHLMKMRKPEVKKWAQELDELLRPEKHYA